MAKANKDGWIRHRGGKCPVDADEKVEVRLSDGLTIRRASASDLTWPHRDCHISYRIMAYRPHKPEQQPAPVSEPKGKTLMPIVETGAGPLEWRDRIREIDAEEAKLNEEHRQAIEALEEERLSLVQKLEDEGLKLIDKINDGLEESKQAYEDMSNPSNWQKGDLITFVLGRENSSFTTGKQYIFEELNGYGSASVLKDDEGDGNGWCVEYFKWHSRP